MNYRHIYHAGNFADVLKHAVLSRLVIYLTRKEKAFRCIDTHAGIGVYDLGSDEAQRTGEWREGIGRLLSAELAPKAAELLAPYLAAVREINPEDAVIRYPGSPRLMRMLMRRQDRLSAMELHPQDAATLRAGFEGDHQARIIELDGWLALGAHLPPKEKRGLVLVDPPFEEAGEFDRMADGLGRALKRWPGGTYCLWYPIKKSARTDEFHERIAGFGLKDVLCVELWKRPLATGAGLNGSGLVIVNPPFTLESELEILLPVLQNVLATDKGAGSRQFRL